MVTGGWKLISWNLSPPKQRDSNHLSYWNSTCLSIFSPASATEPLCNINQTLQKEAMGEHLMKAIASFQTGHKAQQMELKNSNGGPRPFNG